MGIILHTAHSIYLGDLAVKKVYDEDGNLESITTEGRLRKEDIDEIVLFMNRRLDLGYRTVNVDGVNYRIKGE